MIDKQGMTLRGFVHAEFNPYRYALVGAQIGYLRTGMCVRNLILIMLDSN